MFVSGTPASPNATTGQLDPDIRSQVSSALETIRTILDGAGTSLANVVAVTTYLKRAEDFEDYNDEYRKFFPSDFPHPHDRSLRSRSRCDAGRDNRHGSVAGLAGGSMDHQDLEARFRALEDAPDYPQPESQVRGALRCGLTTRTGLRSCSPKMRCGRAKASEDTKAGSLSASSSEEPLAFSPRRALQPESPHRGERRYCPSPLVHSHALYSG